MTCEALQPPHIHLYPPQHGVKYVSHLSISQQSDSDAATAATAAAAAAAAAVVSTHCLCFAITPCGGC